MNKENKEIISMVLLVFLPIILFFASFLMGRYPVSPVDVVKTILSPIFPQLSVSSTVNTIVWQIRLPRILAALLVGASLSMAWCRIWSGTCNFIKWVRCCHSSFCFYFWNHFSFNNLFNFKSL